MGFRDECGVCGIYRPDYLEGDATASSMAYFALVAAQWKCPAMLNSFKPGSIALAHNGQL